MRLSARGLRNSMKSAYKSNRTEEQTKLKCVLVLTLNEIHGFHRSVIISN